MVINKNIKAAFSVFELTVAIIIIGIIAVFVISIFHTNDINKQKTLFKKMTYFTQKAISELYKDERIYPKSQDSLKQGFQNTQGVKIKGVVYEGRTKFCKLFAYKFDNVIDETNCGSNTTPLL